LNLRDSTRRHYRFLPNLATHSAHLAHKSQTKLLLPDHRKQWVAPFCPKTFGKFGRVETLGEFRYPYLKT